MIKEFMMVRLRTGEKAVIMDILSETAFVVEINPNEPDERMDEISLSDIVGIFEETRIPLPSDAA